MFEAPFNKVIVKVTQKYIKNITSLLRMSAIQQGATVDPSDCVNIIGTVISVPKKITNDQIGYEGYSTTDIKEGDLAIFSYMVIYDFVQTEPEADPIYKNMISYKGEEYFACDIQNLFAVIRDTKIRMQNGFIMLEEMQKPPKIILSQYSKRLINCANAIVSHIGKPLTHLRRINAEPGDKVYFNPNKLQIYQINMKPFGIIRQTDVLGVEIATYDEMIALN